MESSTDFYPLSDQRDEDAKWRQNHTLTTADKDAKVRRKEEIIRSTASPTTISMIIKMHTRCFPRDGRS